MELMVRYLEKLPSPKYNICSMNNCRNKAVAGCIYCKKTFCKEHSDPILVMSAREVWNLTGLRESDPIKYKKYVNDWNRTDGHPCPAYTEAWNKKHDKELINNSKIIRFPPKESKYSTQPSIHNGAASGKIRQVTGLVLIIAAIVILVFSYNAYLISYHKTISTSNFAFLFSGIFWDLVGIIIGAVLIAIGLILAYPKGARWLANRNNNGV